MDLTEAIHARRAMRAYKAQVVEDEKVHVLLRAAVQASAMNVQSCVFAVVQDTDTLKRWSDRAKVALLEGAARESKTAFQIDHLRDATFNIFYDASTLIVIGTDEPGPSAEADCWLAAENLMLVAADLGLATCPIGLAIPTLNDTDVKSELRISPAGVVVAAITVGYGRGYAPAIPRSEPRISAWIR